MALIVIDGPCGVGKTRLIETLRTSLPVHHVWSWEVIKRAIGTPKFSAIIADTINAINAGRTVIVEKSWARDSLAEQLKKPTSGPDRSGEFYAEWQFGRLAQYCGLRVMLLAPSRLIAEHRNDEKLITARYERAIYANYAARWKWLVIEHQYDAESFDRAAKYLAYHIPPRLFELDETPGYCGPRYAPIAFVTSADSETLDVCSGNFLPFTSERLTSIGEYYQSASSLFGWSHARTVPPAALRSAKVIIALDDVSEVWSWYSVGAREVRKLGNLRNLSAQIKRGERVEFLDRLTVELEVLKQGEKPS
jgi:hypothetical protein